MAFKKIANESEKDFNFWLDAENAISTLNSSEQELSINQIVKLERSEKSDLLFKLIDQVILDPSLREKAEKKLADVQTSESRDVKSKTLQTAVTSYIQEEFKSGVEDRHRHPQKIKIKHEEVAVHIYLERASRRRRLVAGLIDFTLSIGLGALLMVFFVIPPHLFGKITNFEKLYLLDVLPHISNFVALSLAGWILFSTVYLFSSGQTFGCRQMDVVVVNEDGTPISLEQSILRSVFQTLIVWTLGISGLILWFSPYKALHDFLSGTKVAKFYRVGED